MPNAFVVLALKILVLGTWLVAAAGFLVPDTSSFGQLGRGLFWVLSAVHIVECAVFYRTLARTGRPLGFELLNTLFFGVIHFTEAKAIVDAQDAES